MLQWLKKNTVTSTVIAVAIALVFCYLSYGAHLFDTPRLKTIDYLFRVRNQYDHVPNTINKVVVIKLDDDSFHRMNMRWPYPRSVYAELVKRLKNYNPTIISFDFVFAGHDVPADDMALKDALKDAGNVTLAAMISEDGKLIDSEEDFLKSALASGIINKPRDNDDVIRRARTYYKTEDGSAQKWSWEMLNFLQVLGMEKASYKEMHDTIEFVDTKGEVYKVPTKLNGTFRINYRVMPDQFKTIPFWKVLAGQIQPEDIQGRIVLIGLTAPGFHDVEDTPFGLIPGVYINANAILTLLGRDFIYLLPVWLSILLVTLFAGLMGFCSARYTPQKNIIALIVLIAAYVGLGIGLTHLGYLVDIFVGVVVLTIVFVVASLQRLAVALIENMKLREQAIHDPLTGLFTRRFMEVKIRSELNRVLNLIRRKSDIGNQDLSLIMMDIDHFKTVNDTYGHQAGDQVLKNAANLLRQTLRSSDIVARYGGEEICIILPQTAKKDAIMVAEKLRKKTEQGRLLVADGYHVKITASFGVASVREDNLREYERAVSAVDIAMYHAKKSGRNRVCGFQMGFGLEKDENVSSAADEQKKAIQ